MTSNETKLKNNLFYHLDKKEAIRLTGLIQEVVNDKVKDALKALREKMPTMPQCTEAANAHYTVEYDELSFESQQEYEGIMHGWQDAVKKMNEVFDKEIGNDTTG